jgi:UDP-N-acetylmuramate--alanine ligase
VLAFQPHRYTRTHDLFDDFAAVLAEVDTLVLTDVYSAGEKPIPGADGRALARAIRARGKNDPIFVADVTSLPEVLKGVLKGNDVLLTMGAGNIGAIAATLPKVLKP